MNMSIYVILHFKIQKRKWENYGKKNNKNK